MAAANAVQSLAEEASCSICLEFYKDPVLTECGHNFCRSCLTECWEGAQAPCPQCREICPTGNLKPNRQLRRMVEITQQLAVQTVRPQEQNVCQKHEEKLKLFCQEDATPICVVCSLSAEHRSHTVVPMEEAALQYKDMFQSNLDNLKRKLENILGLQCEKEKKVTDLETNLKNERDRITSVFNKVQQFLEKEKCRHLSSLEEKEKRSLEIFREKVTELDKQQALVRSLITEMESKCRQPDVELLKDVKNMLSRYEDLNAPHPHLEPSNEHEKQPAMDEKFVVEEREEDLARKIIESLEWRWFRSFAEWRWAQSFASEVTLDPDTANRWLILTVDGKSVRHGDRIQNLPDTPERFSSAPCILGRQRLSSGSHYWEVEVGDKTAWSLGVCDESVSRKGIITLEPEGGYWAVWLGSGVYKACTTSIASLTPRVLPSVVGLFLDYEAGQFSVYNLTDRSLLFTFSEVSFPRTLRPYFCPGSNDGGKNVAPLRVLPVIGGNKSRLRPSP